MGSESFGEFAKAYMIRFVVVEVEFCICLLFFTSVIIFLSSHHLFISLNDISLFLY